MGNKSSKKKFRGNVYELLNSDDCERERDESSVKNVKELIGIVNKEKLIVNDERYYPNLDEKLK